MNHKQYDVVVVGSGCAGLAAADELSKHRMKILLVDENTHLGGQLLRKISVRLGAGKGSQEHGSKLTGFRLMARIQEKHVRILNQASVLGISPDRELYVQDGNDRLYDFKSDFIILATGARERFIPFPGWTLPGVISTGAAQLLMKTSGILPGHNLVIGGAGFLHFALASEVLRNGGRVMSVLDQTSPADKMKLMRMWYHQMPRILEGASHLSRLILGRVPIRQQTRIVEARGKSELDKVVTAKVDRRGRIVPGTEAAYQSDTLAVGYGFTPNIELPQQAGCLMEFDGDKGGWAVKVNDHLETSVDNIYAAGETTGIAGAGKSLLEGRMAALAVLYQLGRMKENEFQQRMTFYQHRRNREQKFGNFLNSLCQFSYDTYEHLPDDTVVCRCEEVMLGEIRKRISQGFFTPGALKKATRIGMGKCQGRICGPILYDILAAFIPDRPEEVQPLSVRMPVKLVRLETLAEADLEG